MSKSKKKKQQKKLSPKGITILRFAASLSDIADHIGDRELHTIETLQQPKITKDVLHVDLIEIWNSIIKSERKAREILHKYPDELAGIIEEVLVVLSLINSSVDRALLEFDLLGSKKDLVKHCLKAYRHANEHRMKLDKLSSRLAVEAEEIFEAKGKTKGSISDNEKKLEYSEDFTSVNWFGQKYQFNKTQALCVQILWGEWNNNKEFGLSEKTICEKIGSAADNYKLKHTFRSRDGLHPAWGTMIQACGKGIFRLVEPEK